MSVIVLCRSLPFYAWPSWLRMIVWAVCAVSISLTVHWFRGFDGAPWQQAANQHAENAQQKRDAVRRRLAELPALRLKGDEVTRRTGLPAPALVHIDADGASDALAVFAHDRRPGGVDVSDDPVASPSLVLDAAPASELAEGVMSSAALLAWIEQIVVASGVALRRFEPVSEPMHPSYRAADIDLSGSYAGLYRLFEQFARTEPPLIVASSRMRSDDRQMRWEARVVVTDAGRFRLGRLSDVNRGAGRQAIPATQGPGHAGAAAPNPFARSALPATAQVARLIGVMHLGARNVGLFAYGSKRYLLEAGAMLGDARIVAIYVKDGKPRAELAPLTGEPVRVLALRSQN